METKGFSGGLYRPLTGEQVRTIHEASLHILETTGFTYEPDLGDTLEMLEGAGIRVDRPRSRIFFPRDRVMELVKRAPERVLLYGRDKRHDLDLGEHRVHLGTGGCAIKVLDLETGEARPSTLRDLYQIGRLVNRLENIHFFLRPCVPGDIPPASYDVNTFYACMKGTSKHVMSGVNERKGLKEVIELASLVAGGREKLRERPFISIITSFAISPLKLDTGPVRIMQDAVGDGIPVALSCAPMAGSTSPITMAGTLAQTHAEQLAGISICQLTRPGAPVLYGGIPGMANRRTMGYQGGAVECGMMNGAIHQLAHHIKVPNYNSSGLTDSKIPDAQAGWEKAASTLLTAMSGSNYIHHAAGMLESMITVAYEQYVIDDEIIGMSCKVLKGIEVDPEHLALEVIDSVGPGGNFMTSSHTLDHMREEYFDGNGITDWKHRENWEEGGSLDARERAREKARQILSQDQPTAIPPEIDARIHERFELFLPN